MKLALGLLLITCLTVHARYYKNPFRRSLTIDTKEDVNNDAGAESASTDIGILLRNLVVGPPKGAERIWLKVTSDTDGMSDEIAAITKERENQIQRKNQNDKNPKTERVINVVEEIDPADDYNQQKGEEVESAAPNSNGDGRQSNDPEKTDSNTNNDNATTSENNNKNGDSAKSDGKTAESNTANKPITNNSTSAENSNAGETNANAANDIKKNTTNNANKANANNSANDNKQQQQQESGGSEGNVVAAENIDSDSQSNEEQNADGNSANVERSARTIKKSEENNAEKSISGKYFAKTRGSLHITPLMGHILSVKMTNNEPAPGTN